MSEQTFKMRMFCDYKAPDNMVDSLQVELFKGDEWVDFNLDAGTPGFLIFVYSILACQQRHLRVGCKDCNLQLASAAGDIELRTTEDWYITRLNVNFAAALKGGEPRPEDVEVITARMQNCPISRNLIFLPEAKTTLGFRLN